MLHYRFHSQFLIRNLWKICWKSLVDLCQPKSKGGIGFLDLESFNLTLLCKQGWRIPKNPLSLFSMVMQVKYYPLNSFPTMALGYRPSYVWRSILAIRHHLLQGIRWRIGNRHSIKIWEDKWLIKPQTFCFQSHFESLWPYRFWTGHLEAGSYSATF